MKLFLVLISAYCFVAEARQLRLEKVVRHGIFVVPLSKLETTTSPILNSKTNFDENAKSIRDGGGLFKMDQVSDGSSDGPFKLNKRTKVIMGHSYIRIVQLNKTI